MQHETSQEFQKIVLHCYQLFIRIRDSTYFHEIMEPYPGK